MIIETKKAKRSFYINLSGLVGGFALGQGSFLLLTTWLLADRQSVLLTECVLSVNMFAIILQIVDFGGYITLARVRSRYKDHQLKTLASVTTSLFVCRLASLSTISVAIFTYLFISKLLSLSLFLPGAAIGSLPGLLAWSINQQGRVDAIHKSHTIGIFSSAPWLLMSMGTPLLHLNPSSLKDGLTFGFLYSCGTIILVASQYMALRSAGERISLRKFTTRRIANTFSNGFSILLAWLPGQLSGRVQMAIASSMLPIGAASAFIYARNLLNSGNNIIFLVRRVEFPRLSSTVRKDANLLRVAIQSHKISLALSAAVTISAITLATLISAGDALRLPQRLEYASVTVAILSPFFFTASLAGAFSQTLQALGRPRSMLWVNYLSLAAGIGASALLAPRLQVNGLVIGTAASALTQLAGYTAELKRKGSMQ